MAQIWRGDWSASTTYQPNDAVNYNGSTFICTATTTGTVPSPNPIPYYIPPLATTGSRGSIAALPVSNQALYYARGDNTWQLSPDLTGYAVGPASSVSGDLATYANTTGKLLGSVSRIDAVPVGSTVQMVYAEYAANANLTALIPSDDTIPQNTEGTEILNATITPIYATSKILIRFHGMWAASLVGMMINAALFRDAGVSALYAIGAHEPAANYTMPLDFEYLDSPSSVSSLTYRVRVGPHSASTVRFNGNSTTRMFGGTAKTTLVLQEIK